MCLCRRMSKLWSLWGALCLALCVVGFSSGGGFTVAKGRGVVGELKCPDCGLAVRAHALRSGEKYSAANRLQGCWLAPVDVQKLRHRIVVRVVRDGGC